MRASTQSELIKIGIKSNEITLPEERKIGWMLAGRKREKKVREK